MAPFLPHHETPPVPAVSMCENCCYLCVSCILYSLTEFVSFIFLVTFKLSRYEILTILCVKEEVSLLPFLKEQLYLDITHIP